MSEQIVSTAKVSTANSAALAKRRGRKSGQLRWLLAVMAMPVFVLAVFFFLHQNYFWHPVWIKVPFRTRPLDYGIWFEALGAIGLFLIVANTITVSSKQTALTLLRQYRLVYSAFWCLLAYLGYRVVVGISTLSERTEAVKTAVANQTSLFEYVMASMPDFFVPVQKLDLGWMEGYASLYSLAMANEVLTANALFVAAHLALVVCVALLLYCAFLTLKSFARRPAPKDTTNSLPSEVK